MPWVPSSQILYNILDCVVCVQYLALMCFFFDMSLIRENDGSSIIIDELGNVIVIKYTAQFRSHSNDTNNLSRSLISNDEPVDAFKKQSKVKSMHKYLPNVDAGISLASDDSSEKSFRLIAYLPEERDSSSLNESVDSGNAAEIRVAQQQHSKVLE